MKSVGTKLTFFVVVFPILLIAVLSAGVIYVYHQSLEASVVVEVMSTLSSVVLVDLLVWERLRESLSKKLNYFHDNYLSELRSSFSMRGSTLHFYVPTVERLRPDLKRYGKFMGISLYPKNLPSMIGRYLILYEEFKSRFVKIESIGKELFNAKLNVYLWCHVLGIKHWEGALLKQNIPMLKLHEGKAQLIKKENDKLIGETREFLEKAERIQKSILERLDDFFKSNSLEFEPEMC